MALRRSRMAYCLSGHWRVRWQAAPMPEMPAPRISTSMCSAMCSAIDSACMSDGFRWSARSRRRERSGGRFIRRDEAVHAFEILAVVVVPGVEAWAEVVGPGADQADQHTLAGEAVAEERAPALEVGETPVGVKHAQVEGDGEGPEHHGGYHQGAAAHQVGARAAAHQCLPHVEGHRLVFGLFQRMPAPQRGEARVGTLQYLRLAEQGVGQDGCEVLQRDGGGELQAGRQAPLQEAEE